MYYHDFSTKKINRNTQGKVSTIIELSGVFNMFCSWWFQPLLYPIEISVKLGNLPQTEVKKKNYLQPPSSSIINAKIGWKKPWIGEYPGGEKRSTCIVAGWCCRCGMNPANYSISCELEIRHVTHLNWRCVFANMFAKGEGYHVMMCHVYLHVLYQNEVWDMLGNIFHQDINNGGAVQVAPWPKGMDLDLRYPLERSMRLQGFQT